MINIKCETTESLTLGEMVPFQGTLKKRTPKDINALCQSLKDDGLLMPFVIWRNLTTDEKLLIDGHGRREALLTMVAEDPLTMEYQWPVLYVDASTEDDARKALLQISSTYGKINVKGLVSFTKTIPTYKAPIIKRTTPIIRKTVTEDDKVIVRLRLPKSKVAELTALLKTVSWIEVY